MKKRTDHADDFFAKRRFNLKMKITTTVLLILAVFSVKANSYGQEEISLQMDNVSLENVIEAIEAKTDYRFIYKSDDIDLNRKVSLNHQNRKVRLILTELFDGTETEFEILRTQVILRKSKKPVKKYKSDRYDSSKNVQQSINGTVLDENGQPLPGANIIEKGTTNGVVTDFDGNFTIEVNGEASVLVVSYIGYVSQEISVGSQTNLTITLAPDAAKLDEVVIIGYGTVARKDVTGAVSTVTVEDFNKGVISSPEQLFQGKLPGIQITSDGGEPGGSVNVRIRGTSSVRSGNNPLYVVNGIPLNGVAVSPAGTNVGTSDNGLGNTTPKNPLSFLNPNDIQSVDILKDASATAIYGSRGANGVVIITTKKGKSGKGALQYSSFVGASTITKELDLLTASEFASAVPTANEGANTDWQDVIFRTGLTSSHHINYGGGSEDGKSLYQISAGYSDQDGIVEGSGQTRYSGSINTSYSLFDDRLNLNMFAIGTNVLDDNPQISNDAGATGDLLSGAWRANPTRRIFNDDGTFFQPEPNQRNPAAIIGLTTDKTNTLRVLGGMSADLKLTNNLTYKFNLGLDRASSERRSALSRDLNVIRVADIGIATLANVFTSDILLEHTFNFTKEFENSNLNVLAGYSYQKFKVQQRSFQVRNFQTSDLDIMLNNLEAALYSIPNSVSGSSRSTIDEIQSYFGRFNYALLDKYIFTGTLRADGSSKFGENNRFGYFPSAAFAWRLSNEDFIGDAFYDLKLRLGYGITGNQEFPGGSNLNLQRFDNSNNISAPRFANPDLKWESTTQLNVGLDYAFLDGKIRGSLDFYNKTTTDLLLQLPSPEPAPSPFFFGNLDAEVKNTGVEFGIEADVVNGDNFKWTPSFNLTFNDNEVTKIDRTIQTGAISGPGLTGAFAQVITQGQPLYAYFLRTFDGFDANGLSIEGASPELVGKSPLPTYTFGFTNYFEFGDFDLNIFLTGQGGNYIYNNNDNAFFTQATLINSGLNVISSVVGNGEDPGNGNGVSTRFLEKGDFIRLQNATLGYSLNTDNIKFLDSARITLTGQNLFTITDYSGQDPEVNVDKNIGGVPSFGIDYTAFPRARTITLGLNVTLN